MVTFLGASMPSLKFSDSGVLKKGNKTPSVSSPRAYNQAYSPINIKNQSINLVAAIPSR